MLLSEETINVLKNYASINGNLFIEAGSNEIKTWTVTKNIYAKSSVEETFPNDLPIYDLNELLSVIDIYKGEAEIEFGEQSLVVGKGNSKVEYEYSDPNMLSYPTKDIQLATPSTTIDLSKEDISNIINVSSRLSAPDVSIKNDNDRIVVTVYDAKGATSNNYTIDLCDYDGDIDFDVHIKTENLKLLSKDYTVSIFNKKLPLVYFKSTDGKNEYYIAIERSSVV